MVKPFDVSKFRKDLTKSITGLGVGFNDPTDWVSTGNYALNYLISGDFHKGVPLGKVTVFAGESGAGKSYFASGNIVRHAQQQGIFVVLIDTENALDEKWLQALGVDTDESKLLKLSMSMIDDVAKTISTFMGDYKTLDDADKLSAHVSQKFNYAELLGIKALMFSHDIPKLLKLSHINNWGHTEKWEKQCPVCIAKKSMDHFTKTKPIVKV